MKRYEYKELRIQELNINDIIENLNSAGADGWTVCSRLSETRRVYDCFILCREVIDFEPANEQKAA